MNESDMMHGNDWDGRTDLTGWIASEKYNGCRAFWDGKQLWSRNGKVIKAPAKFTAGLPSYHLDCEIWGGYEPEGYEAARLATEYGGKRFLGLRIRLVIFDAPSPAGYEERFGVWVSNRFRHHPNNPYHMAASVIGIQDNRHAVRLLGAVLHKGGEGLVAYKPGVPYRPGRTSDVLKIKPVF